MSKRSYHGATSRSLTQAEVQGPLSPVGGPGGQTPRPKFILRVILTKLGRKYTHRRTIPTPDKHQR